MSTFGDVKFYSSRAFLDDDDEAGDDAQYDVPTVSPDWTEVPPTAIQTLLVSFGDLANGYCRQEVLDDTFTALGSVKACYSDQSCGTVPAPVTLALCHGRGNTVLALCPDTRDADVANAVAQELVSLLKCSSSSTTIVVTTEHISKLRTASQTYDDCSTFDAPVVIHCLLSPAFSKGSSIEAIKQLPQPAMIYSVPAAVLTACTLKKLSCVVYVAYTETICGSAVCSVRPELSAVLSRHPALHKLLKERGVPTQKREELYVPDNYS